MKKLFYATGNKYKIQSMRARLEGLDIELIVPKDLNLHIDVEECGKTVVENAVLKAKAYYDKVKMPTLAADTALYVEKFEKQPGLFVHRINGKDLTPEETLKYYTEEIEKVGGKSKAFYKTGLAIIKDDKIFTKEIKEDEFMFTSKICDKPSKYDILSRIEYYEKIKKYKCELTDEEVKNTNNTFNLEFNKFIKEYL